MIRITLGGGNARRCAQSPRHSSGWYGGEGRDMQLRGNDITWREVDGEMVILDLVSSTYLTTNHTGAAILRSLVEERSYDQLVDTLVEEFDISRQLAETDVTAFVDLLRNHNLLEAPPTSTADR
jgi:Coenzyme PQQ synthesis protein D (PqqD)